MKNDMIFFMIDNVKITQAPREAPPAKRCIPSTPDKNCYITEIPVDCLQIIAKDLDLSTLRLALPSRFTSINPHPAFYTKLTVSLTCQN